MITKNDFQALANDFVWVMLKRMQEADKDTYIFDELKLEQINAIGEIVREELPALLLDWEAATENTVTQEEN